MGEKEKVWRIREGFDKLRRFEEIEKVKLNIEKFWRNREGLET